MSRRRYRLRGRDPDAPLIAVPRGTTRIGAASDNDVVLTARAVSRCHARLELNDESLELVDEKSRNGTFVNGEKVSRQRLAAGDVVRLGPVEWILEQVDAGDVELALALGVADSSTPGVEASRASGASTALLDGPPPPPATGPELLSFPPGTVASPAPAMRRLYEEMAAVIAADLPVLIEGETGVGKEVVVRVLHASSRRRDRPLVALNCAAIPADLLEAELFGIEEGVATGVRGRQGRFRAAMGGWLFLDEVGELPPPLQAKLLRVLQEREIQPLGGAPRPIDVRLAAATNLDLQKRVEAGEFRRDLYFRLAGFVLRVPPLRERREEIPALIEHFLSRAAARGEHRVLGLTVNALRALTAAPWPGNVRELEHHVTRLFHLCPAGGVIDSRLLDAHPPEPASPAPEPTGGKADDEKKSVRLEDRVRETERRAILEALEQAGSQRGASRLLGIARTTLARKIRDLGLDV